MQIRMQLKHCLKGSMNPFVMQKLLCKTETPQAEPQVAGETPDAVCSKFETAEMKALKARIEAGEARIAALEERTVGDMVVEGVKKDAEQARAYVEGQYNNAVARLTTMRDDLVQDVTDTLDEGKAAVEAQMKELMALKAQAEAELATAEAALKAEVARIDTAVRQGWGDLLESGAATLAEVENFANLTKEQALTMANEAWDSAIALPEQAWKKIESGVGYTAEQALLIMGKMQEAGRDVQAFAEKACKNVSTYTEAQLKVLVETVKDNKKALAALAAGVAALPAAPALLILGTCLAAGVGIGVGVKKLGETAVDWAAPQFQKLVQLCAKVPENLVALAKSGAEFTQEQVTMLIEAAKETGTKLVETIKVLGPQLLKMGTEELKELAQSIGQSVEAAAALVEAVLDGGAEKVLAVLDTLVGAGVEMKVFLEKVAVQAGTWTVEQFTQLVDLCSKEVNGLIELAKYNVNYRYEQAKVLVDKAIKEGENMVAIVEAFGENIKTWSAEQLKDFTEMVGENVDAVMKILESVKDEAWEKVMVVVDTALGLGVSGLRLVEALGTRVVTLAAEELKALTEMVGENVDAVVKILESVKDEAWEKVMVVVDTALGLGVSGLRLIEALGTRVTKLAVEELTVLMDKLQAQKDALVKMGEHIKDMAVDTAIVYLKKAQEFGVDTQKFVVELANEGAAKAMELLAAATKYGYEIPKAFFVALAKNMATWTENEITEFVAAVESGVIQLNNNARIAYREARRHQRKYQRVGKAVRTGTPVPGTTGSDDTLLAAR